jgi:25S rRNA (adenine2142-N1)-methyltransferase
MPKSQRRNRRKNPVTITGQTRAGSSTAQSSRKLINKFHNLIKQKAQLQKSAHDAETDKAIADLDREIEGLGGLKAYQRMSAIGQGEDRGGGSHKVLVVWLKDMNRSLIPVESKLRFVDPAARVAMSGN